MTDFAKIESLFNQLLITLHNVFTAPEMSEVEEFVDVGEYGVALDTVVDIFIEEDKGVPSEVIDVVAKLASAMGLSSAEYVERLQGKREA